MEAIHFCLERKCSSTYSKALTKDNNPFLSSLLKSRIKHKTCFGKYLNRNICRKFYFVTTFYAHLISYVHNNITMCTAPCYHQAARLSEIAWSITWHNSYVYNVWYAYLYTIMTNIATAISTKPPPAAPAITGMGDESGDSKSFSKSKNAV